MMQPSLHMFRRRTICRAYRGFTLMEALICVAIVGIAITAVSYSIASTTSRNAYITRRNYAVLLAANLHEYTANLPYWDPETTNTVYGPSSEETASASFDNILDFTTERAFNPPIDGSGVPINQPDIASNGYTQIVSVTPVNPDAPTQTLAAPVASGGQFTVPAVRVTVRVVYRSSPTATPVEMYRLHWIRCES